MVYKGLVRPTIVLVRYNLSKPNKCHLPRIHTRKMSGVSLSAKNIVLICRNVKEEAEIVFNETGRLTDECLVVAHKTIGADGWGTLDIINFLCIPKRSASMHNQTALANELLRSRLLTV